MDATYLEQSARMVAENRRLFTENESLRRLNADLKQRYDTITAGVNDMVEDHRRVERELQFRVDKAERSEKEVSELLLLAADTIHQGLRARVGDKTPTKMPAQTGRHVEDDRLPIARLS